MSLGGWVMDLMVTTGRGIFSGMQTMEGRWWIGIVSMLSCTKYVWYCGHRDHISCVLKTEELFQEHFLLA